MRKLAVIGVSLGLAACTTPLPTPVTTTSRPMTDTRGLERVLGSTAEELTRLFGEPAQDFREEGARKLQFAGASCVLDAYLYPESRGRDPVATYVDARNAAGDDVDRAACVEALARR